MNDEELHSYIEPELEARIVALVVGEASDFETEELERLIAEKPELEMFRTRMKMLHGMLRQVGSGEKVAGESEWKLSEEKRERVLGVIGKASGEIQPIPSGKARQKPKRYLTRMLRYAAGIVLLLGITSALMFPASKSVLSRVAIDGNGQTKDALSRRELPLEASDGMVPDQKNKATTELAAIDTLADQTKGLSRDDRSYAMIGHGGAAMADSSSGTISVTAGGAVDLSAEPEAVEFDGFLNYEAPINGQDRDSTIALSNTKVPVSRYNDFPVAPGKPELRSPKTADVEDKIPFLGDLPQVGQLLERQKSAPLERGLSGADTEKQNVHTQAGRSNDIEARYQSDYVFTPDEGNANALAFPAEVARSSGENLSGETESAKLLTKTSAGRLAWDSSHPNVAATIDASGNASGDTIRIGGDFQGTDNLELPALPSLQSPDHLQIAAGGSLDESIAARQPAQKEYFNYPGHPASVQLKPELAAGIADTIFDEQESNRLYAVVPKVVGGGVATATSAPESGRFHMAASASDAGIYDFPSVDDLVTDVETTTEGEGEKIFGRQFLGGADQLSGFDYREGTREGQIRPDIRTKAETDGSIAVGKSDTSRDVLHGGVSLSLDAWETHDSRTLAKKEDRLNELEQQVEELDADITNTVLSDEFQLVAIEKLRSTTVKRKSLVDSLRRFETQTADSPFSTFSLHVGDASFLLARASLAKNEWPEADRIRIEEFVNAFDYGDPVPSGDEKVSAQIEQAAHPFLQQRNLLRLSMRTATAGRGAGTPLRLTFLLDNSGSMEREDRRETVRRAFAILAGMMQPEDRVTLISFARQPRLLADKIAGDQAGKLVDTIRNLPSEGGTNLEAALQLAFEKAKEQHLDTAQNRIVLLTDGAANLGDANPESLARRIETMREAGIAFDAAGVGTEGLNDEILEALTRKGDGRYYLLAAPDDADAGFAKKIAGAFRPAAKNVKVQIEFNPKRVPRYQLLGFDKHRLKKEDFRNDKVDAAELAAEEAGVAVYHFEADPQGSGDVGFVSVRFLDMSTGRMVERKWTIPYQRDAEALIDASPSLKLASASALFAAKLKGGPLGDVVEMDELATVLGRLPGAWQNREKVAALRSMLDIARELEGK